jgi:acid phosphatase family membrane protein YuiD
MTGSPWFAVFIAGGIAQVIKLVLALARPGPLGPRALVNLPGMPSTWAAMCGALCICVWRREGLASPLLAAAVAFSCLVLYDALKLRRSAGRQARLLNAVARDLELHRPGDAGRHLRELLGETPAQVLAGLALGIAVGLPWPLDGVGPP